MRKYTKYIALGIILSMVTLGFASKNNLGVNFLNIGWSSDAKEISQKEVQERVQEKVIDPITASLTVRNPHLFMTKCYSSVEASLDDRGGDLENRKFYENQTIIGSVKLIDCGSVDVICKYQLSLNSNDVKVRESYLKPWITLDEFLKQIETVEEVHE
ncbi:MAG: hypothetical protein HRT58_06415 [Crocinitomicaceae bacterium]|nr:SurA N-terminal domain-containing protein [Flavobacteriales bacterium]NQZ35278.1 hypothetical protein [Crocinitomicaceae bacterium]